MGSADDANKVIGMIKIVGPWASVFLVGAICGYFLASLF